jgi:hypothetical protein
MQPAALIRRTWTVAEHLNVIHVVYGYKQLGVSITIDVCRCNSGHRLDESVVDDCRALVSPIVGILG